MSRIMITTSSRVASCMTAQGFNIKVRNFTTGRFIPFEVLDTAIDTSGIFSVDEINQTIVERFWKRSYGLSFAQLRGNRPNIIAENHVAYDKVMSYDGGDSFDNYLDVRFQCDKRNLCWLNKCYEIYA